MKRKDHNQDKEIMSLNLEEIENQSADVLSDWGEIAIDSFFENGAIKEIPIFGTALKVVRGGKAIRDYFFIQKLSEFVRNAKALSPDKIRNFRMKLQADRDFAKRTATHLAIVLDRFDELEKATLLAKIFGSYINGLLDQHQMKRLASALDRTLLTDIVALKNFMIDKRALTRDSFYGLEGVGLASVFHSITRPLEPEDVHGQIDELHFVISPTAVQLINILFNN